MIDDWKLPVCAALSIVGHFAFAKGLEQLPERRLALPPRTIEVRVIPPPEPEPEPKKPDEPKQPEPIKPELHERPRAKPVAALEHAPEPRDPPPIDHQPTTGVSETPHFGVSIQSTSQGGGPSFPVGNTTRPTANPEATGPATTTPLAPPVAAYEVTKMPLPQGRCTGKYTDEARAASIEGTVVLDLTVGEDGRTRDIKVVTGLGHGLTDAAIAAVKACRFSPGEKDGTKVPVRVRGFKIRFLLADAE